MAAARDFNPGREISFALRPIAETRAIQTLVDMAQHCEDTHGIALVMTGWELAIRRNMSAQIDRIYVSLNGV